MNRTLAFAAIAFAICPCAGSLASDTTVNVSLQDPSTGSEVKGMRLVANKTSAPAGVVRFRVSNDSRSLVHEMIVVRTGAPVDSWAYDARKDVADETKLASLGEVSELQAGKTGTLRLVLKPGSYRLFCNQPGHLHGNMWTSFDVLPGRAAMLR